MRPAALTGSVFIFLPEGHLAWGEATRDLVFVAVGGPPVSYTFKTNRVPRTPTFNSDESLRLGFSEHRHYCLDSGPFEQFGIL